MLRITNLPMSTTGWKMMIRMLMTVVVMVVVLVVVVVGLCDDVIR